MIYPVWRQDLVRSLHIHRSKAEAKYIQVASVALDGKPKLRTMVFRGFHDASNSLLAVTDIRSEKVSEWQAHPFTELHWYFAKSREQYRISCELTLIFQTDGKIESFGSTTGDTSVQAKTYKQQWHALSDGARAGFFCPAPKSEIYSAPDEQLIQHSDYEAGDKSLAMNENQKAGISQHFAVVVFNPISVDYLDLKTKPHTRTLQSLENNLWKLVPVNP
ncbi:pyridoxamine 5'-phosphate oxidase family protein [Glaciecola sp. SC05]|uniref:pyridoxamine 5'-phosphate oxidase family protein n=1 Tax=Glaciecola sp. SC05 TaxID=1987355 RepID=UPI003528728D